LAVKPRGASPIGYSDFLRTGPGTLAGRYLRSFWQPVYRSQDLAAGHAVPIRIMSEDFTLYRGEGGVAHVVAQRCAHRGTQLSTGWVEGDCIRCFYHGWKYDGSGQCVEQPAEDAAFCHKVRINSYPTHEYVGLIFAYLGEGEAPPLPSLPEFEVPEYDTDIWYGVWPCNYFAQLDNAGDPLHTAFVHRQWGWGRQTVVVEETEYGLALKPAGADKSYPSYVHMPNSQEWAGPPQPIWTYTKGWRVPVDDYHHARIDLHVTPISKERAAAYRRSDHARQDAGRQGVPVLPEVQAILSGAAEWSAVQHDAALITIQDLVSLVGLGPIADQPPPERLGRSDVGVIALRKLWAQELQAFAEGRPITRWNRPDSLWEAIRQRAAREGVPA
jgi:5,5'-dehydrodivanillate O-demethylase oxygenase subunit